MKCLKRPFGWFHLSSRVVGIKCTLHNLWTHWKPNEPSREHDRTVFSRCIILFHNFSILLCLNDTVVLHSLCTGNIPTLSKLVR